MGVVGIPAKAAKGPPRLIGAGILVVLVGLGAFAEWGLTKGAVETWTPTAWLLNAATIVVLMMLVGWQVNGRPDGLLIDNRNRVSLSRFQAAAWTVLVLSGLATAVAFNLNHLAQALADQTNAACKGGVTAVACKDLVPGALEITIPNELLIAMGISAASLVATPAILSLKSQDDPLQQDVVDASNAGLAPNGVSNVGKVFARNDPKDASWTDMFRGEEVGNVDSPDLSKVQQFLITLILLAVYAAALWRAFVGPTSSFTSLPAIDGQFIWLMGISHAGYLAYKAAPQTASASSDSPSTDDPRTDAAG